METLAKKKENLSTLSENNLKFQSKAKEIEESIRYAGNLQQSILPNQHVFQNTFDDAFVLYQPKDILSGDFYWFWKYGDDIYFAMGDCTGHGVPGALVQIAGNTLLRQLIKQKGVSDPAQIIQSLDEELVALFNDNLTNGQMADGMDIIFCKFNLQKMEGEFCAAGRPLLLIRDSDLIEFKKGSSSVGYNYTQNKSFETVELKLQKGDQFYLFSDGYTDQFGGENIKKFNRKRFRKLLMSIREMPMSQQKKQLDLTVHNWMGKHEQIDDICVVGVKV